jgi:hypothetical protein
MKHNAVVVTGWNGEDVKKAHDQAIAIFKNKFHGDFIIKDGAALISPIISGISNQQDSFMIAPDGSKEGWSSSNMAQEARDEFQDWLLKSDNYCDYIEVRFGGDDDLESIQRSKHSDIAKA